MMELLKEYSENPSIKLRNKIVEKNINLVYLVIHRHFRERRDYEDLVQEGRIELVKSVERFDINLGFQFSSYAIPRIRGALLHYIRDKSHIIKVPRIYSDLIAKAKQLQAKAKLPHCLTDKEIAANLEVDLETWLEAKRCIAPPRSLDYSAHQDSELTLGESISDESSDIYDYVLAQEESDQLESLLSTLPKQQRQTLELLYFRRLTHKKAAIAMGISTSTILRNKNAAIKTLRSA